MRDPNLEAADAAKANLHRTEATRIRVARLRAANLLRAPEAPAKAVRASWAPLGRYLGGALPPTGPTAGLDYFHGSGPPPAYVAGAGVGDRYVDDLTGDYYELQETTP